jgi:Putative adhesin
MIETDEINRSFPVNGLARLTVRNVDGFIDIAAGEADVVSVRAYKHPGPGAKQTEIEITQDADGRVSVITHYLEDVIARLFQPRHHGAARVDYTIRLPKACEVDVAFVSGSARLQGLQGEFALRSVSGPIDLEDLAGHLKINTVSGPVTGAHVRLEGSLAYDTVSADIILADSLVPAIAGNSVSGQVRLQTELGAGPYHFRSVSGDVWLAVPSAAGCRVDMHSLSGRLRASQHAVRQHVKGGWTRMAFGAGGGPAVSLQSVSGDLHLVTLDGQAGPEAEPPAAETAPPAPTESAAPTSPERLAILDRLARGELSVDEAVNTLKQ